MIGRTEGRGERRGNSAEPGKAATMRPSATSGNQVPETALAAVLGLQLNSMAPHTTKEASSSASPHRTCDSPISAIRGRRSSQRDWTHRPTYLPVRIAVLSLPLLLLGDPRLCDRCRRLTIDVRRFLRSRARLGHDLTLNETDRPARPVGRPTATDVRRLPTRGDAQQSRRKLVGVTALERAFGSARRSFGPGGAACAHYISGIKVL
jgi:hypothetical protein